jgi:hypothetical protein
MKAATLAAFGEAKADQPQRLIVEQARVLGSCLFPLPSFRGSTNGDDATNDGDHHGLMGEILPRSLNG